MPVKTFQTSVHVPVGSSGSSKWALLWSSAGCASCFVVFGCSNPIDQTFLGLNASIHLILFLAHECVVSWWSWHQDVHVRLGHVVSLWSCGRMSHVVWPCLRVGVVVFPTEVCDTPGPCVALAVIIAMNFLSSADPCWSLLFADTFDPRSKIQHQRSQGLPFRCSNFLCVEKSVKSTRVRALWSLQRPFSFSMS